MSATFREAGLCKDCVLGRERRNQALLNSLWKMARCVINCPRSKQSAPYFAKLSRNALWDMLVHQRSIWYRLQIQEKEGCIHWPHLKESLNWHGLVVLNAM